MRAGIGVRRKLDVCFSLALFEIAISDLRRDECYLAAHVARAVGAGCALAKFEGDRDRVRAPEKVKLDTDQSVIRTIRTVTCMDEFEGEKAVSASPEFYPTMHLEKKNLEGSHLHEPVDGNKAVCLLICFGFITISGFDGLHTLQSIIAQHVERQHFVLCTQLLRKSIGGTNVGTNLQREGYGFGSGNGPPSTISERTLHPRANPAPCRSSGMHRSRPWCW